MIKLGFAFLVMAGLAQPSSTEWTAYSATYTETSTLTDASGHKQTNQTTGEEIRSSDGSLLTTKTAGGERISAKLWQACGQMIDLDYKNGQAIYGATASRKHPDQPPDAPVGTISISGLQFVGYPVHMPPGHGTGTVWIDMNDDIMGKLEYHVPSADGGVRDVARQLTAIDFNTSVDPAALNVPSGFTKAFPRSGIPAGCVGK